METSGNKESSVITPAVIKSRCPRVARQLAWCAPGIGHMYLGSLVRGLWFMAGSYLPFIIGLIFLYRGEGSYIIYAGLLIITVVVCLYATWDTLKLAKRTREDYRLKDYNNPSAYILMFLMTSGCVAALIAFTVNNYVGRSIKSSVDIESFDIYRGDMMINYKLAYQSDHMRVGDRIVFKESLSSSKNKLGKIIAFPESSPLLGTEESAISKDYVIVEYLNGKELSEKMISAYSIIGKLSYRIWPPQRFGEMSNHSPK